MGGRRVGAGPNLRAPCICAGASGARARVERRVRCARLARRCTPLQLLGTASLVRPLEALQQPSLSSALIKLGRWWRYRGARNGLAVVRIDVAKLLAGAGAEGAARA